MKAPSTIRRNGKTRTFVLLMSSFMFLILFLTNALRVLKESLLIAHMGVESLSYIRIALQLPFSLLVIYLLTALKRKYSQQRTFNLILWFYIVFMAVFTGVLYPHMGSLPACLTAPIVQALPAVNRLLLLINFWPVTLLYLLADLWPLLIYVNCFWELSNRLVDIEEAAQIYPLYNILGQSSILFTGLVLYLSNFSIKQYINAWGFDFMQCLGSMAFLVMLVVVVLYNYIIARYTPLFTPDNKKSSVVKKLTFKQTVKLLYDNRHIANIFICTLLYYTIICIVQTLWLYILSIHCTTSSLIGNYQAIILIMVGVSTLTFALMGRVLLDYWGWHLVLQILPFTMLIFSTGVLICYVECTFSYWSSITFYLSIGMYVLAKSMKYTFFDATKEMAYIPAEESLKFYGKLSADTLANSLGKVIGNLFPLLFFTYYWERPFDRVTAIVLSVLLVLLSSYWIFAAWQLKRSYQYALQSRTP